MRLLVALVFPWLLFFTIGRPFAGIICLFLQITILGGFQLRSGQYMLYHNIRLTKKLERLYLSLLIFKRFIRRIKIKRTGLIKIHRATKPILLLNSVRSRNIVNKRRPAAVALTKFGCVARQAYLDCLV